MNRSRILGTILLSLGGFALAYLARDIVLTIQKGDSVQIPSFLPATVVACALILAGIRFIIKNRSGSTDT